jgi:ArsR family transcriptional regulator, zinc-responsive transcriptional repressor
MFFSKLANKLKMDIIVELNKKSCSVLELANKLSVEQSKLSHALASLKCCSIVKVEQAGKKRIYSLNKETIVPMLNLIDVHEKKFCEKCRALDK